MISSSGFSKSKYLVFKILSDFILTYATKMFKIGYNKFYLRTDQEMKMQVRDMTVEQLRDLIRHTVEQRLEEYFGDPYAGLEVKQEVKQKLLDLPDWT